MRLQRPILTLAMILTFGAIAQAQTVDPYVPLFRHLLGFARDTTPNGVFDGPFEDIDGDDLPIPGSYHMGTTLVRDGATITYTANSNYAGFFAAKNDTSLSISNIQHQGYYTIAGQGSHTQVQFFAPVTPAEATFNWKVTGTASAPYGTATSRLDFLAGSYPGSGINDLYNAPGHLLAYGPGNYSYVLPTTLNTPIDLFYWSSAYIEVQDTDTAGRVGQSFSAFANFSSTYTLESIDLRDSNGDLIPSWTMEDTSAPGVALFNQNGRTAAAGSSAPEPTTLLFLTLGGTLVLARRRRS
ncbi:PEP-CTERM sorting domain-containing protein [Armatimonas rosea]|uniref:PEP-CTERM protein-sorting domain-containing protein n=1 Tax=Armatimonas rosea TaxID=685828 RepID=A0A7W9SLW6_ARMRO|nr:PEP-CTERM sorting domain-containing protein [Armatimonas rosea]MBB6049056.1 hypothetical protein [Armatimonas rosea]